MVPMPGPDGTPQYADGTPVRKPESHAPCPNTESEWVESLSYHIAKDGSPCPTCWGYGPKPESQPDQPAPEECICASVDDDTLYLDDGRTWTPDEVREACPACSKSRPEPCEYCSGSGKDYGPCDMVDPCPACQPEQPQERASRQDLAAENQLLRELVEAAKADIEHNHETYLAMGGRIKELEQQLAASRAEAEKFRQMCLDLYSEGLKNHVLSRRSELDAIIEAHAALNPGNAPEPAGDQE